MVVPSVAFNIATGPSRNSPLTGFSCPATRHSLTPHNDTRYLGYLDRFVLECVTSQQGKGNKIKGINIIWSLVGGDDGGQHWGSLFPSKDWSRLGSNGSCVDGVADYRGSVGD